MSKPRKYYSAHVLPIGIAKFAYLDEPQPGFKPTDKPKYKVRCLLDDTEEVRAKLEEIIETAKKEAKEDGLKLKKSLKNPIEYPEDQDEDDYIPEEGKEYARLDEDHKGRIFLEAKSSFPPLLIDAMRETLPESVKIMSGDKVRVKIEARPYDGLGGGVSLRLKAVQLVEKNTSAGGYNYADGFDDIEGGYTAPPVSDEDDEDF